MYDFKQLSPADFEDLTRDLLQQEWGVRLEVFKAGRDSGIDLRCSRVEDGTTIVQCKHFAVSGVNKLLRHLRDDEASKVALLAPARYVLVTSVPLSPKNKAEIRAALHPHVQADEDVLGAEDLNNLLTRHPDVEQSNFKLWLSSSAVLQRVLHNAERMQAEFEVERVRRRLPLYVQSAAYPKAVEILAREHVVVISGVPGIGKTTLADLLLFAHLEQGYEPVVIKSEIAEAKRLFNRERKQVFYYDDFLGQTFLGTRSDFLGRREDGAILDFADLVARSRSAKFILTTREHLLQRAFGISERFERERATFAGRQCILGMGQYGLRERGRILYNHIYFSDLPPGHRQQLLTDNFYLTVLRHRNFNPRLVEWLSRSQNLRYTPAEAYRRTVATLLDNPSQLWRVAFEQQVSEASRSLLLALYALGGEASLEDELRPAWAALHRYRAAHYNLPSAAEDWRAALQELEGGFLSLTLNKATFVNPSVKDFLDEALCTHPDHVLDLLASAERFQPVGGLWALAASEKGADLRQQLSARPETLIEAIGRVLHGPSTRKTSTGQGNFRICTVDATAEARLLAVVRMTSLLQSKPLRVLAESYVGELATDWDRRTAEYETLVAILSELDDADSAVWNESNLHGAVKALTVATLTAEPYCLEGFYRLAQYVEESNARLLQPEQEALVEPFRSYLSSSFGDDLNNMQGQSELEDLGSELQTVSEWLGVGVDDEKGKVAEKLDELHQRAEAQGEEVGGWRATQRGEMAGDEQEVRRLFDGLTENGVPI